MIITASELRVLLGLTASATDAELALIEMAIPSAQAAVVAVLQYDPERAARKEILPINEGAAYGSEQGVWQSSASKAYLTQADATGELLQLRFLPVRSVTALYEDQLARHGTYSGAFAAASKLTEGEDFQAEYDLFDSNGSKVCTSGLLRRVSCGWSVEPGTILVDYVAGYSAAELNGTDGTINARPIKDAVLITAVRAFRQYTALQKTSVGFVAGVKQSETLGDYSYTLGGGGGFDGAAAFTVDVPPEARALLGPYINFGATFQ